MIAMVTTFFICVMMMLPLLMIRNVRAKIILFKNNVTRLIVDVDYVLSRDAMLAYMKDYLPYFLWFGLQILPMFIFLFLMVYCACTIARRRHRVQMSERSKNNTHISTAMMCVVMMAFISEEFPTTLLYGFGI